MHYYPFHISDYISHTRHLSDVEDLAYRRMIDLYYHSEQPFPNAEFVARKVKSTPEIISVLLSEYFVKSEDGWRNKRADVEIAKYHTKAESARHANKVKLSKRSDLKSDLISEPNHDATNNHKPITNNHKPIKELQAPDGVSVEVWESFLMQRKKSKAVVTETVIKGIRREADKAGWSLEQALSEVVARGWRGFKADWVIQKQTESERGRTALSELTRGLATGERKNKNFWELENKNVE